MPRTPLGDIYAIPNFATHCARVVRKKEGSKEFRDTISTSMPRREKFCCWASKFSDVSSRPWRNLPPTSGDPHGGPQTSPQHADPHGFLIWFLCITIQEIHVDRSVVRWSAGRHVDHPCGGQIVPWPPRKVTDKCIITNASIVKNVLFCESLGGRFGYFLFFFCSGRGKGSPRLRGGGGCRFFFFIEGFRGGGFPGGGGAEGAAGRDSEATMATHFESLNSMSLRCYAQRKIVLCAVPHSID